VNQRFGNDATLFTNYVNLIQDIHVNGNLQVRMYLKEKPKMWSYIEVSASNMYTPDSVEKMIFFV